MKMWIEYVQETNLSDLEKRVRSCSNKYTVSYLPLIVMEIINEIKYIQPIVFQEFEEEDV